MQYPFGSSQYNSIYKGAGKILSLEGLSRVKPWNKYFPKAKALIKEAFEDEDSDDASMDEDDYADLEINLAAVKRPKPFQSYFLHVRMPLGTTGHSVKQQEKLSWGLKQTIWMRKSFIVW